MSEIVIILGMVVESYAAQNSSCEKGTYQPKDQKSEHQLTICCESGLQFIHDKFSLWRFG